jgi:hypothetical protein
VAAHPALVDVLATAIEAHAYIDGRGGGQPRFLFCFLLLSFRLLFVGV